MYKKITLLLVVVGLSVLSFVYKEQLYELFKILELQSDVHPIYVGLILIALKTVSAPLGFPGTPLTLLTGSIFGVWIGTAIAIIGNITGAVLAFILARYIFKDYTKKLVSKYPSVEKYITRFSTRGLSTILFLRLVPLFPFNVINFLLGVTPVSLRTYTIGTFIGIIPGTFLFVYLGGSLRMLSPFNIALSILGIILLTLIGKYYEKRI